MFDMKQWPVMRVAVDGDRLVLRAWKLGGKSVEYGYPIADVASEAHARLVIQEMMRRALDELNVSASEMPRG